MPCLRNTREKGQNVELKRQETWTIDTRPFLSSSGSKRLSYPFLLIFMLQFLFMFVLLLFLLLLFLLLLLLLLLLLHLHLLLLLLMLLFLLLLLLLLRLQLRALLLLPHLLLYGSCSSCSFYSYSCL